MRFHAIRHHDPRPRPDINRIREQRRHLFLPSFFSLGHDLLQRGQMAIGALAATGARDHIGVRAGRFEEQRAPRGCRDRVVAGRGAEACHGDRHRLADLHAAFVECPEGGSLPGGWVVAKVLQRGELED